MTDSAKPVKLAAKLPKGNQFNGAETIHDQLKAFGSGYLLLSVSTRLVRRFPGNVLEPEMQIEHVEGLPDGDLARDAERLMTRARLARLGGAEELPLDFGDADEDDHPED